MTQVTLHPGQSEVFKDLFVDKVCRYAVAVCSRGWGKSHLASVAAINAVFELLSLDAKVPNKNVYIVAPTYAQVVDIYHPLIAYQLGMDQYAIRHSKDLGRFWFPDNVELRLVSYEAVERLRGTGAYFVVSDEISSWKRSLDAKEAWQSIIQPCINTRWSHKRALAYKAPSPGRALFISTPEGYNFLHELFHYQERDPEWKSYHYDYTSSPLLDPEEIERVKHTIDPIKFAREYKATFEDSGNNVFYCFDRKIHIRKDLPPLEPNEAIHVGIDFNVGIQASSFFVIRNKEVHFIDEMKGHPDTENLARAIKARFPDRRIYAYPDPTGRARKTSAAVGVTDFSILESHGIQTRARTKSPPIVDSVACVNRKLKNAAGEVQLFISPNCTGIIQSLERTKWLENNPDTAALDKSEGVEHFSDSVRYPIEYLYPINLGKTTAKRGFKF